MQATTNAEAAAAPDREPLVFSFGEPTAVLDRRDILDYLECVSVGKWYEPPVSLDSLARLLHVAVHHSSPMYAKRNILTSTFIPHKLLSHADFQRLAMDHIVLGNGYVERKSSRLRQTVKLEVPLARYMRRGVDLDRFFFVQGWHEEHEFPRGSVLQLMEPDINQEVYGLPSYLAAINSALLNESATLFRRRYYKNGSHAGYILYMTDAAQSEEDVEAMRKALKESKGPGNFRNLFMYAPNGKKDGIQLIPVAEVAAKDEFLGIKNISRDDMLAMHRVPPQLIGIIPSNTGGFGDAAKAAEVFARNEIVPLQEHFRQINEWMGEEVVRFRPYTLTEDPAGPGARGGSAIA